MARELARRGVDTVGVDLDRSMIATARRLAPELTWVLGDISSLDLGRRFDVVVMAGNVPIFTPDGTQAALVAGCARHLGPGGCLIAGFQLDRGYALADLRRALPTGRAGRRRAVGHLVGRPFEDAGRTRCPVHQRSV